MALALALLGAAATVAPAAAAPLPPVRHVFVIVLENKGFDETFGALSPAPYLSWTLPSLGAFVPNYYGVSHVSLPNYVAMISGQGANPITQSDCQFYTDVLPGSIGANGQAIGQGCVYPAMVTTVADQLAARGLSWKGYMEDMGNGGSGVPQTCRHPALNSQDDTQTARKGDEYAARHNPFVYFHSIIDSPACAADDVPLDRLPGDLRSASTTPSLSFITPNLCDDGHDAPCVDGRPGGLLSTDAFLRVWVPRILSSPGYRDGGLLLLTFDESDGSDASACCNEPQFPNTPNNGGPYPGAGGGRVGAVALSPYIDPGTVDLSAYNHFSLLRSIEDLFGLSHLGYAAQDGLSAFGADLFTCYRAGAPARPRAARGTLVKYAGSGIGASGPPLAEVKLWYPGRVSFAVRRSTIRGRFHRLGRTQSVGRCQLAEARLPYRHGTVQVTARAYGSTETRTFTF